MLLSDNDHILEPARHNMIHKPYHFGGHFGQQKSGKGRQVPLGMSGEVEISP